MPKGKVLIVDDEQEIKDVFRHHLEGEGYSVLEAGDGEEAIQVLRQGDNMMNVGLILCDIRMPRVNGVECIDFFRDQAPGIPVAVITGYPDKDMATSLIQKGVKDYVVKPVEKSRLVELVDDIVKGGKDFEYFGGQA
ncbi:MAG: response regulator [Nitrospinaceae bacterium]|nr:response regulator [Nitrospinaceae bacterium]NIR56022.1 response regulator [Nitrospinaceae bacterium]NIS86466.1 response regulator [Nitrospinaceae bacterium]NIT83301.1 response regulator [Nitrospinaceae bacterium]NIU45511.1 response regulator [Nitrospinaceae bacterium]